MTADKKQTSDRCPKQEVEVEEGCGPCDSAACDAEVDDGCETCE